MTFCNPTFELNRETICEQTGKMYEVNNIFIYCYGYFYTAAFKKAFEAIGKFTKMGIEVRAKWEE